MNRRGFLSVLSILPAAGWLAMPKLPLAAAVEAEFDRLQKTDAQWRELLELPRYRVLFKEDTERPNSSPLNAEKRAGKFICAACFLPLFESRHKYESGTGWPSFTQPIEGRMETKTDYKAIWPRTEYHCVRCGGHQGHVFDDGPRPRGERWCNNGLALDFVADNDPLPELRT